MPLAGAIILASGNTLKLEAKRVLATGDAAQFMRLIIVSPEVFSRFLGQASRRMYL